MTKKALLLCLLLPFAQAHSSPDPLDVELHMVADEAEDYTAFYDGWDIQDIYVREAFIRSLQEHGIMVRFILYGGFPDVTIADSLEIQLDIETPNGTQTFAMSTSDAATWTGSMRVMEQDLEPAEYTGSQGSVQAFISYAQLGVEIGDTIGTFSARSYTDDELRDEAPGPLYVPGTGGAVAVPESGGSRPVDTMTLAGPIGYMKTTLGVTDTEVQVDVENLITVIGQHFVLSLENTTGWTTTDVAPPGSSSEPGEHPSFLFSATPSESAGTMVLVVDSDLGGREELLLKPPTSTGEGVPVGEPVQEEPDKDTPIPFWLALVALALVIRRE